MEVAPDYMPAGYSYNPQKPVYSYARPPAPRTYGPAPNFSGYPISGPGRVPPGRSTGSGMSHPPVPGRGQSFYARAPTPYYGDRKYMKPESNPRVYNPMTGGYYYPNKPNGGTPVRQSPIRQPPTGAYFNQERYAYGNIPGIGANARDGDGWAYAPL
jgi:hypothetical protein